MKIHIPARFYVPLIIAAVTYAVFEAAVTLLYLKDVLEPPPSFWLFEDSGKSVHFDPILGYRLTPVPSRTTRITKGTVEYIGELKGNNQGFPDRDDFFPERGSDRARRFAVFGDSYTAAGFLGENWPDRVEDLTREGTVPLRLFNFAVDGGGLANWWSVLTRLVEKDGYQIDGVIFAVIPGNLWRGFSVADHRDQKRPMFGRVPTWDPKTFPATLDEARKYLQPQTTNASIVSTEEFDRGVKLEWRPSSDKPIRPYFARKVWRALRGALSHEKTPHSPPRAFDSFDPDQERMIQDMARTLKAMGVPVMVIHVPSREELLQGKRDAPPPVDTRLFAALLDARLVDGREAFAGRSVEEIRAMWLPYDAHWGQTGSNRFAEYMTDILVGEPARPR